MASNDIPKIVHISWKRKDIFDNQSPLILNGLKNLCDLNPEWKVVISDDDDVDNELRANLAPVDYQLIAHKHIVEKTDLWRLIKIYTEGGLYIDLDRFYNRPLHKIIEPKVKCVLPTYFDLDFSQDIMLSGPKNPIFSEAINLNLQRRREGCNNLYQLGAPTYMHAITKVLLGVMIDRDPGPEKFAEIRQAIAKVPFLQTYREQPPNDTLVFQYDEATFKVGNGKGKDEFYAECGVRHWTT